MILEGHFSAIQSKILSPVTEVGRITFQVFFFPKDSLFGGNHDENNINNIYRTFTIGAMRTTSITFIEHLQ